MKWSSGSSSRSFSWRILHHCQIIIRHFMIHIFTNYRNKLKMSCHYLDDLCHKLIQSWIIFPISYWRGCPVFHLCKAAVQTYLIWLDCTVTICMSVQNLPAKGKVLEAEVWLCNRTSLDGITQNKLAEFPETWWRAECQRGTHYTLGHIRLT